MNLHSLLSSCYCNTSYKMNIRQSIIGLKLYCIEQIEISERIISEIFILEIFILDYETIMKRNNFTKDQ